MEDINIIYREYKDSDLKEVLDLWEHFSGWGRPNESEFKNWLLPPFGNGIIYLAIDTNGRIVGQIFYTPTLIYLKGIEKSAVKVSSPIIHEDYRSSVFAESHSLVIDLFIKGNKYMKKKGYEWLYVFPAYGWVKSLKAMHRVDLYPWKIQVFSCLEILDDEVEECNYVLKEVEYFSSDFNMVWKEFRSNYPNLSYVNRSIKWLNFKWVNDLKVGIYDNKNILIGYFVIKKSSGLVLDFLMKKFLEVPTLLKELKKFHLKWVKENSSVEQQELKIISNDFLVPFLDQIKTKNISYHFVFGISSTISGEEVEKIDNDEWIVFPND